MNASPGLLHHARFFFGALLLAGCHRSAPSPTPLTLLTGHGWRVVSNVVTATGAVNYTDDLYARTPACGRDDFYRFQTDFSYVRDEGATRCYPTDPQSYRNTWRFENNDTELVMNLNAGSYERLRIQQLTATTLELVSSATSANATFVHEYHYTAQ